MHHSIHSSIPSDSISSTTLYSHQFRKHRHPGFNFVIIIVIRCLVWSSSSSSVRPLFRVKSLTRHAYEYMDWELETIGFNVGEDLLQQYEGFFSMLRMLLDARSLFYLLLLGCPYRVIKIKALPRLGVTMELDDHRCTGIERPYGMDVCALPGAEILMSCMMMMIILIMLMLRGFYMMGGYVPSHGDAFAPVHPDEAGNPYDQFVLLPDGLWYIVSRSIGNHIRAYYGGPYMAFKEVPPHTIDQCHSTSLIDDGMILRPHSLIVSLQHPRFLLDLTGKSSFVDEWAREVSMSEERGPYLDWGSQVSTYYEILRSTSLMNINAFLSAELKQTKHILVETRPEIATLKEQSAQ
ncbi:hypothetical protein AKJ16_DCAP09131 [Drosera capensis]